MLDPNELYQLADDRPELGQPVLIQALTGFVDAGNATRLAREHLLSNLDGRPLASFDIDQLLDYRSRRPVMTFVEDHWESYDDPRLLFWDDFLAKGREHRAGHAGRLDELAAQAKAVARIDVGRLLRDRSRVRHATPPTRAGRDSPPTTSTTSTTASSRTLPP